MAPDSVESPPMVSVIVLSLNGADVIRPCLDSLLQNDYPNFETIVVNNGSTDNLAQIVAEEYPRVRLLNLPRNYGFAGGMNEGFKIARGDIFIELNDDTVSPPELIRELIKPIQRDKTVGMVGCKILYMDGKTIQHAGGSILPHGHTQHYGYNEEDRGQWDEERDVDYVTGCCVAVPRRIFEELGLLDDRLYPTYFDDADHACRIRKAGYRILYCPAAELRHMESKTEIRFSDRFYFRYNRSRLRFILRNYSFAQLLKAAPHEIRWWRHATHQERKANLKAYIYTLPRLPRILMDRNRFLPLDCNARS